MAINPNLGKNLASSFLDGAVEAVNPFLKEIEKDFKAFKKGVGLGFKTDAWIANIYFTGTDTNAQTRFKSILTYGLKKAVAEAFGAISPGAFAGIIAAINNVNPYKSKMSDAISDMYWKGFCQAIRIPSTALGSTNPYGTVKIPTNRDREKLSLTFYNDQWNVNYTFWQNYMNYIVPNFDGARFFDDYACNISIDLLNTSQNSYQTFVFKGCAPVSVDALELSGEASKDLKTITVDFVWEKKEVFTSFTSSNFLEALSTLTGIDTDEQTTAAAILGAHLLVDPGLLDGNLSSTVNTITEAFSAPNNKQALDPDRLAPYIESLKSPIVAIPASDLKTVKSVEDKFKKVNNRTDSVV